MKYRFDKKYIFYSAFNSNTGFYCRSGILDENNAYKELDTDPFMASFPHLIDIGIMGHCVHGMKRLCEKAGVQCYQNGPNLHEPNMSFSSYKRIMDECDGKVYQVALGGRGDPDQHEDFEKILEYTRKKNIVPNYTTSGLGMTESIAKLSKKYCGAVAVSWYRNDYTYRAIELLKDAGVKTNIHYVLSKETIKEAIHLLDTRGFPEVNAIIFLLHKPVGLGSINNVIQYDSPEIKQFFRCIETNLNNYSIGFDSCTVPGLLKMTTSIDKRSIETCEGARFSCYISPDMKISPCSFDVKKKWSIDLTQDTLEAAWNSEAFEDFRLHLRNGKNGCEVCQDMPQCLGGCPIESSIILCDKVNIYV